MNVHEMYRSDYMKSDDLNGQALCLSITECLAEKAGGDERLVLAFFEVPSLMILDRTNTNMLAELYGPETSEWRGKVIKLAPSTTLFLGQVVKYIRICHERCDAIPID
ncbi:MAG: hypothetical protein HN673_19215 [Rhodospirillales bacterium]|jgi:hypothetical protein|nr:hypothetical protein [Rhodospirillales bacterium]